MLTINLPFADPRGLAQIFAADERMTCALLGRLTHPMHIVAIEGDSFRLKTRKPNKSRKKANPPTAPS